VLALNCLVLGDDPKHVFTVEIASTKTVSILKEEIWRKKQNTFKGVDADTLVIWEVSVPADHTLQEKLRTLKFVNETSLQLPAVELSNIFLNVEQGHLNIVIRPPPTSMCPHLTSP
jgi:hypothetical protein